MVQRQSDSRCR